MLSQLSIPHRIFMPERLYFYAEKMKWKAMKNNTARKMETFEASYEQTSAEIIEFKAVAQQAEQACHLPRNAEAVDFEEFLAQYGKGIASDFA